VTSIEESDAVELHQAVLNHAKAASFEIRAAADGVDDETPERLARAAMNWTESFRLSTRQR